MGKNKQRLVWFSEVQWDFLSTRKQRLLARFPDSWDILFYRAVSTPWPSTSLDSCSPWSRVCGDGSLPESGFLSLFGRLLNIPVVRFLVGFPELL